MSGDDRNSLGESHKKDFSRKHAAATTETLFNYFTFQDVTLLIVKSERMADISKSQIIKKCFQLFWLRAFY